MVGAANVIHGYIRLARTFRDLDAPLSALDILRHVHPTRTAPFTTCLRGTIRFGKKLDVVVAP